MLYRLPVAPALRSAVANTKVRTRALMRAPAHMTHGSRVTTKSQSSRRQRPRCWAASRSASTSACAVGSFNASRSLCRAAIISFLCRTTAPTGTSPDEAANSAWSSATRIAVSYAVFMAEEVGFEPTETCASHAFQACRFGRSRTPPGIV